MNVQDSPVKETYRMCLAQDNPEGRNSWDQTTVLTAIKGYEPYFGIKRGTIVINDTTGANRWIDDPKGRHAYLTKKMSVQEIKTVIENYMKHQPVKK